MKGDVATQRQTNRDATGFSPGDGIGATRPSAAQGATACEFRSISVLEDVSAPRWKHGECLQDVLDEACRKYADRVAVSTEAGDYTFHELNARANQMARYFATQGIKADDRVAILLDRGFEAYAALFGLLKVRATYVPLDANNPADRLAHTLSDAAATRIVTQAGFADNFSRSAVPAIVIDTACDDICVLDDSPLLEDGTLLADDALCYILYTSGSTGRPKGVAVAHRSICNFVRVSAEQYGFRPSDRVYQGMSFAFDFSMEEFWVPLVAGATVVPNTWHKTLFGEELADFLERRGVTCFCGVPTLLASIEWDLPLVRLLLIGGEACPPALVARWAAPGRKLLNTYGPTEATVTAALGELCPEKAITIGRPMPTYTIVILDPLRDEALPLGDAGEIGIAGIGVAEGYLNRQELTEAKFIPDFLSLPNNLSGRIYRSGDLGRINDEGEIEYLGRLDTQVKLRGHRVELGEIETVLLEVPEISQAAAAIVEVAPGAKELVAYYAIRGGASPPETSAIVTLLRSRLPHYMIPAYLECLAHLPTLVSNKVDRECLPAPKSSRLVSSVSISPPTTATERVLCHALGETLGLDEISVDGDFFYDYGGHSLLLARFCTRVRTLAPMLAIAMRDVYAAPNVRELAAALDTAKPVESAPTDYGPDHRPSSLAYFGCGALQLAFYMAAGATAVAFAQISIEWQATALASPLQLWARGVACVAAYFIGANALAVVARWLLLGRGCPAAMPIWSMTYFRYWVVKQLTRSAPANLFIGTPPFNVFLRALGAQIGPGALIVTRDVPVIGDLLRVGPGAVVARRSILLGVKAVGNRLYFGRIDIGAGGYAGDASVLDTDTSIGDFGQLGHTSMLASGQAVPAGKRYHGSPAEETTTNFRMADEIPCSRTRRVISSLGSLTVAALLVGGFEASSVAFGASVEDSKIVGASSSFLSAAGNVLVPSLLVSLGLYLATLAIGLVSVGVVPRLANRALKSGRLYRLYGFHHAMQRLVENASNSRMFNLLFGDSVFIDGYLRWVGWRIRGRSETGSSFGTVQRHDNPFLCTVGAGTITSDSLNFVNISQSSSAFRLGECRLGADNYIGNDIWFLAGSRVGDNCLIGTKAMMPIDGPMRENTGLLGSPAFEIPRSAARDVALVAALSKTERRERLSAKTRHNLVTMALLLVSHWAVEFVTIYLLALTATVWGNGNFLAMAAASGAALVADLAILTFVDRASFGFRRMAPLIATVYDPAFWAVERYWKLSQNELETMFAGTPFSPFFLRLTGVKVGRRVFNDGCGMSERTLVEIGDGANLNAWGYLQSHSMEEGVFKSDVIRIGAGVSVGVGSLILYGVEMGDGAILDADAFLMKGEVVPAHSRWGGNPAKMTARG